jgi:hypothetical protein
MSETFKMCFQVALILLTILSVSFAGELLLLFKFVNLLVLIYFKNGEVSKTHQKFKNMDYQLE